MTIRKSQLDVRVKKTAPAHWLERFRDQPQEVIDMLIDARDQLARAKAAQVGMGFAEGRRMVEQLLSRGHIRFEIRHNLLDEPEGVDVHSGGFTAKNQAIGALKRGEIRC